MPTAQLSVYFFLQMAAILAACRVVGSIARRFGQPQVVGEMIAGVVLGPSLFGYFLPGLQQALFPKETMGALYVGAQLGVGLYMFLVGLNFSTDHFRSRAKSAVSVSLAGMIVPFALGAALSLWLFHVPGIFTEKTRPFEAALFLAASMSITAFPMLARIIHERGITGTSLGTLALAAGAIDDAAAWCVLAIVLASFGGGASVAVIAICGGAAYAAVMFTIAPRFLKRLDRDGDSADPNAPLSPTALGVILMLFCLSAWAMDAIGVHAVFGGFLLGAAMPKGVFAQRIRRMLEPFVVVFLLPIFFTYSGLNTRLDMVGSPTLLLIALVILVAATVGKGVACWAAARLSGEENRTAMAVGTLMNARGLMELIILNIGLQKGVIGLPLFAIMVLMAITTTLMASPVFEWVYGRHARARERAEATPMEVA